LSLKLLRQRHRVGHELVQLSLGGVLRYQLLKLLHIWHHIAERLRLLADEGAPAEKDLSINQIVLDLNCLEIDRLNREYALIVHLDLTELWGSLLSQALILLALLLDLDFFEVASCFSDLVYHFLINLIKLSIDLIKLVLDL